MTTSIATESNNRHVWRTGMLFKKGKKYGLLGRANWKPRFVVLTADALEYYAAPGGALKGKIDLTQCKEGDIEVMPHDCPKTGHSMSTIWRIAIQTPARRFFVAANTAPEMDSWFQDLVEITRRGKRHSLDWEHVARMEGRQAVLRAPSSHVVAAAVPAH
ncbi:Aste57867_23508 [Aphanomyces stellatus]|uniref:Aste57867_23508 protein n=1 Tax=Aphanomyces stellatus TaxID=120398 RepID=A0A485LPR3_9STRA|nr:hypothetical protein As57867_023437 [Aphanomyces stellatus]VFU00153.1 Aste57867_23508 [Aphanomyces stellatus]